jgi:hypothetical protein
MTHIPTFTRLSGGYGAIMMPRTAGFHLATIDQA